MTTPLDTVIVTDGNRAAFERVINVVQQHDEPQRIVVCGPRKSGKTVLLRARSKDRDLLSPKKVTFRAAMEIVNAVNFDAPDSFFEELGSVDVLLIDDFQDFCGDEVGETLCKLMLKERARLGLDTVMTSRVPLSNLNLDPFEGALDGFEEIAAEPLDEQGRVAFVRALRDFYEQEEGGPLFTDEAVAYLANEFSDDLDDVRHAIQYFMTAAGVPAGETLDAAIVKQALTA